ncbi:hypothetical protein Acr_00g0042140 [Actinidia rufa]|uniref:DUF632 domain-containing protein n=1 Tax=Actinidia rufa TaxID=165716 RepID=A0A7J0DI71_9ERIC|nr:hypothetical protein Acr_00g0042140 [Actinidia rufa]
MPLVLGRLISDGSLLANELFNHISHHKKGKIHLAALKLDMSKAFDRGIKLPRHSPSVSHPFFADGCSSSLNPHLRAASIFALPSPTLISTLGNALTMLNHSLPFALIPPYLFQARLGGWQASLPAYVPVFNRQPSHLSMCLAKCFISLLLGSVSLYFSSPPAKYCSRVDLLQVKPNHSSSWAWKSLLYGRDLIAKGVSWVIGNGSLIRIYLNNGFQICKPPFVNSFPSWVMEIKKCLSSFLSQNQGPSGIQPEDKLVWPFTSLGTYFTKSGKEQGICVDIRSQYSPCPCLLVPEFSVSLPPAVCVLEKRRILAISFANVMWLNLSGWPLPSPLASMSKKISLSETGISIGSSNSSNIRTASTSSLSFSSHGQFGSNAIWMATVVLFVDGAVKASRSWSGLGFFGLQAGWLSSYPNLYFLLLQLFPPPNRIKSHSPGYHVLFFTITILFISILCVLMLIMKVNRPVVQPGHELAKSALINFMHCPFQTLKMEHEKSGAEKARTKWRRLRKAWENQERDSEVGVKMMVATQDIAAQDIETASAQIVKLRESELYPQLVELIKGSQA